MVSEHKTELLMIDNNTKPEQILVIDDNEKWLETLKELNMQTLYSKNKTSYDVYSFVQDRISTLTTVILNANILSHFDDKRIDFSGTKLLNDILFNHFPKLNFHLISFTYTYSEQKRIANYIDFLCFLNKYKTNGK